MNTTILVAEDDIDISNLLTRILTSAGYTVRQAFSGTEARMCLEQYHYDLMLMDLMLPGITGEALLDGLRRQGNTMPVIVISAKISVEDRIGLLKAGADDYITKPFDVGEVFARVEAQLRRCQTFSKADESNKPLTAGPLTLNPQSAQVTLKDTPVALTAREFKILHLLMAHPRQVFTREQLFNHVWEDEFLGEDNTINVHISNLRRKLAAIDPNTTYIKTVWGIGFKLDDSL